MAPHWSPPVRACAGGNPRNEAARCAATSCLTVTLEMQACSDRRWRARRSCRPRCSLSVRAPAPLHPAHNADPSTSGELAPARASVLLDNCNQETADLHACGYSRMPMFVMFVAEGWSALRAAVDLQVAAFQQSKSAVQVTLEARIHPCPCQGNPCCVVSAAAPTAP